MKKYAIVFVVAIFVPSLVLGWLALRTAGKQRVIIERQTSELHQAETDAVAGEVRGLIEAQQRTFSETVRALLAERSAESVAENFENLIRDAWSSGGVPFAISPAGGVVSPNPNVVLREREAQDLLSKNASFLSNAAPAEVYQLQQRPAAPAEGKAASRKAPSWRVSPVADASEESLQQQRNIVPQQLDKDSVTSVPSSIAPVLADFQTAIGSGAEGILARFVQDDLTVLLWTRPDPKTNWVFGLMLGGRQIDELLHNVLPHEDSSVQLAILDDRARPVVRSPEGFEADWKRPFVATEIGEVLPHWEAALYLANPDQITSSARLVTQTLVLLIAIALAAILAGSWLVGSDVRRQMELVRKKSDFVSNVSHELKTPLTSIRMFSELLAEDRVQEPEKRRRYLQIIAGESQRLARLVNNVLDFARIERGKKSYDMRDVDLGPVIAGVWESERSRLAEAGFAVHEEGLEGEYVAHCDADAIVQVLVNLISNAEKYGGERKEIGLRVKKDGTHLRVDVLDRGLGVPHGMEKKIFEAFFRADDSLASGIQGSGLGLTLARRIARDHGGDVTYEKRVGGGAEFSLSIPLKS